MPVFRKYTFNEFLPRVVDIDEPSSPAVNTNNRNPMVKILELMIEFQPALIRS